MVRGVARLAIATMATVLFGITEPLMANAASHLPNGPAAAAKVSSSISSVAAKAAYIQANGKSRHQSVPTLDSAPVRSAVVPRALGARSISGTALTAAAAHTQVMSVRELEGEQNTILELRVAPGDLGKVIGKQGRTARSIRTLLGAASMKLNRRYTLEILE